ncbi:MAG: hypothetical protein R3B54_05865 [Bdellovibrionota bacterium]
MRTLKNLLTMVVGVAGLILLSGCGVDCSNIANAYRQECVYARQTYPGQQYPGQYPNQYPGQQYPGQYPNQYPGQYPNQYPNQQYPGQYVGFPTYPGYPPGVIPPGYVPPPNTYYPPVYADEN